MEKRKKIMCRILSAILVIGAVAAHYLFDPWGFYWKVPPEESALRMQVVEAAESWLGCCEADGSHKQIIDLYNSHEPLAMDYVVQYTDSWCSTFVSAVAIECNFTDVIPTECGCERQIKLFQALDCWEERDSAIPLPGDLIFYDWNMETRGECNGWADHVGIVVGTKWPFVKVIEGNYGDAVAYRVILLDDVQIRGFGRPNYANLVSK